MESVTYSILLLAFAMGLIIMLAPSPFSKQIRMLALLIFTAVIINVFKTVNILKSTYEAFDDIGIYTSGTALEDTSVSYLTDYCADLICRDVQSLICERFGINDAKVGVELDTSDYMDIKITAITIRTAGQISASMTEKITTCIKDIMFCEVKIINECR